VQIDLLRGHLDACTSALDHFTTLVGAAVGLD
jgi:hypothetical protein